MKDLLKYQKTLCFVKMPSVLTTGCPKTSVHFKISTNYIYFNARLQSLAKTSSVYPNI